jgi:uncharacterized protein YdiU (UPF0061 family)
MPALLDWDTSFLEAFQSITAPNFISLLPLVPFGSPVQWGHYNHALAEQLGLATHLDTEEDGHHLLQVLSGNALLDDKATQPYAVVYAGHQFGYYVPQLGDGRATTLGTGHTPKLGTQTLQLKGAGQTPYSRMGDGRAVLRSSIREYLCSEAMHALGIPTTRALSLTVALNEPIYRETIEPAAVVCRVAPSFLRFGNTQFWAHHGRTDVLTTLANYTINHYLPELQATEKPYHSLVFTVIERTARLIAQWQSVGFCHGVMNTDNMSVLGLTLDYGPFGFLDAFNPAHIWNPSDTGGRYAYNQQPAVGQWNVMQFVVAMKPLLGVSEPHWDAFETTCLRLYETTFYQAFTGLYAKKLGLPTALMSEPFLKQLLQWMAIFQVDYTNTFRSFSAVQALLIRTNTHHLLTDEAIIGWKQATFGATVGGSSPQAELVDAWLAAYQALLLADNSMDADARKQQMNACNPQFVLRNYLLQQAIVQAEAGDFSEIDKLFQIITAPFDQQHLNAADVQRYTQPPPDWAKGLCISCSS